MTDQPLAKWEEPFDPEFTDRCKEAQRWSLAIRMEGMEGYGGGYYQLFGHIEKPYGGDRYYLDRAPPTEEDLTREKKAFEDGLRVCHGYTTEEFRATQEFTSFATLEEAKAACIARARKVELKKIGQTLEEHHRFLKGTVFLEKDLIYERDPL